MPRLGWFVFGCLVVRSAFVVAAYWCPVEYLYIGGIAAVLLVLSWLRIMLWAPRDQGFEVEDGKIWWQSYRTLHVLNYSLFALLAFLSIREAYIPLALDVLIGASVFTSHYYLQKKDANG
jgi:hypothetical protein